MHVALFCRKGCNIFGSTAARSLRVASLLGIHHQANQEVRCNFKRCASNSVLVPRKGQNPGDAAEENSCYHSCGWGACHNPSFCWCVQSKVRLLSYVVKILGGIVGAFFCDLQTVVMLLLFRYFRGCYSRADVWSRVMGYMYM